MQGIKEELKLHNIDIDKIEFNTDLLGKIQEAEYKMREYTSNRLEVILNNNLIEAKDKYTGYRTILGCRLSYDNLDKNISFIVREDTKPTYEELENRVNKALSKLESMFDNGNDGTILDDLLELDRVLSGDKE